MTSWWAHFQMRNVKGTKEWLQQFCLRASVRFVVRKIESRIVAEKFSDEGECFA